MFSGGGPSSSAAFSPCHCGLVAPVCPSVKAMSDSREQLAATTAASAQPADGAAESAGA
jgi:hypothetical protein